MTISSEVNKSGPYTGDGVNTSFAYGFKVLAKGDMQVVHTDSAGAETVLVVDTDYTVNDVGSDTGTIDYPVSGSPLPSGETLTIVRDIDFLQNTDFDNQGGYYPDTTETAFDRLTMMCQQLEEELDRSLKLNVSDAGDPQDILDDIDASVLAAQTAASGAATSETNAGTSETNAAASEAAAGLSETNAAASETAAGLSETNAAASEAAALVSETNAAASETAAGLDAAAAAVSAAAALVSETNAAASEAAALVSETNAVASETASGLNVTYSEEWAIQPEDTPVSVAAGGDGLTTYSALHWAAKAAGGGGGLANVVDDTTPELGGDLTTGENDFLISSIGSTRANRTKVKNVNASSTTLHFVSGVATGGGSYAQFIDTDDNDNGAAVTIGSQENETFCYINTTGHGTGSAKDFQIRLNSLPAVEFDVGNREASFYAKMNVANVTDYEAGLSHDDDIPNKKYVDDAVATAGGLSTDLVAQILDNVDYPDVVTDLRAGLVDAFSTTASLDEAASTDELISPGLSLITAATAGVQGPVNQYSYALDADQTLGTGTVRVGDAAANAKFYGQQFIAAQGFTVTTVSVKTSTVTNSGNYRMDIYSDDGAGSPLASLAQADAKVNVALDDTVYTFTWTGGPTLVAGTKYWVVLKDDTTGNDVRFFTSLLSTHPGKNDDTLPGCFRKGDLADTDSGLYASNTTGVIWMKIPTGVARFASTSISEAHTAKAQPNTVDVFVDYLGAPVLNTDLIVSVSRDGGTTWTAASLADYDTRGDVTVAHASVDVSGQPAGTSMLYKVYMSDGMPIMTTEVRMWWA